MKRLLVSFVFSVPFMFGLTATAQTVTKICVDGTNSYNGGNSCIPVTSTNPLPVTSSGSGTGNVNITKVGGNAVTTSVPVSSTPSSRTYVPLDVATVTTGGTAVTALIAGHHTAGGFLTNPKGATIDLCINEQGAASGTTSAGATTCIPPGASYTLSPAAGAVSVVTSDSAHPFSGYGLN